MEERNLDYDNAERIPRPEDTKPFGGTWGYEVVYSQKEKKIIIMSTEYHSGELYLDKSELEELLKKLDEQ